MYSAILDTVLPTNKLLLTIAHRANIIPLTRRVDAGDIPDTHALFTDAVNRVSYVHDSLLSSCQKHKTRATVSLPLHPLGEHIQRPDVNLAISIQGLVNNHCFAGLAMLRGTVGIILAAPEMPVNSRLDFIHVYLSILGP